MGRLRTYTLLHKSLRRIRLLYDVTSDAYLQNYTSGREVLRDQSRLDEKRVVKTESGESIYPVALLTYHSRDVYPALLRSILLVRLISAFEAFLADTVEEISIRDLSPFKADDRVDMQSRQLFSLYEKDELVSYVIKKFRRQITNSSISDVRKFYLSKFSLEISPDNLSFATIEEYYDRRHLYVHSEGHVDGQYLHKYPDSGVEVGKKIPVSEEYLFRALRDLDSVAKHIKRSIESRFPGEAEWRRFSNNARIESLPQRLRHVEIWPDSPSSITTYIDGDLQISEGKKLSEITYSKSYSDVRCRILIGGNKEDVHSYLKFLHFEHTAGAIIKLRVVKISD